MGFHTHSLNFPGHELIDTLWNVNYKTSYTNKLFIRINRYIMECKYL